MRRTTLVDLTRGEFRDTPPPQKVVEEYLGGRGVNMWFLNELLEPGIDPLGPENPLIVGPGLLTGTATPSASRMNFTALSPESRILGDSNAGGYIGARMKSAGFDRVILTGKAPELSYVFLNRGKVEIRDARDYKGMNNTEFRAAMKRDLGRGVEVACIGEAGERLVRFASIMTGIKNTAGRTGMGAVMGSKNLKAIVVGRGGFGDKPSDEFRAYAGEQRDLILGSGVAKRLGIFGTPFLYDRASREGRVRTFNSIVSRFLPTLDGEHFAAHYEKDGKGESKRAGCSGCVVKCRHKNDQGGEGPEYSSLGLLGANLGIWDPKDVIRLNNVANDLGLDTSSAGSILGWAMQLYNEGLIVSDRVLRFADAELAEALLNDISKRKGIGDVLAESTRAVDIFDTHFGEDALKYLIEINGLPQSDPHDCREIKSFLLSLVVSSRGADHLRGRPTIDMFPQGAKVATYGAEHATDAMSYDSAAYKVVRHEDIYAVGDSLGVCRFVTRFFNGMRVPGYEEFSKMLHHATGMEVSAEELVQVGKRIVGLERRINTKLGVQDTLPWRYMQPNSNGNKIDPGEFEGMLQDYYGLRGWDIKGRPPVELR